MGEFADYALEEVETAESERLDWRTGKMPHDEAYEKGIIDELGFEPDER